MDRSIPQLCNNQSYNRINKKLSVIENEIAIIENQYLRDTRECGNIVSGFESFLELKKERERKQQISFIPLNQRIFSLSSIHSTISQYSDKVQKQLMLRIPKKQHRQLSYKLDELSRSNNFQNRSKHKKQSKKRKSSRSKSKEKKMKVNQPLKHSQCKRQKKNKAQVECWSIINESSDSIIPQKPTFNPDSDSSLQSLPKIEQFESTKIMLLKDSELNWLDQNK